MLRFDDRRLSTLDLVIDHVDGKKILAWSDPTAYGVRYGTDRRNSKSDLQVPKPQLRTYF